MFEGLDAFVVLRMLLDVGVCEERLEKRRKIEMLFLLIIYK